MEAYSYTGNDIPIDINLMTLYVIDLLKKYDENIKKDPTSKSSPYEDKITMKTKDEKYIEIPNDVQQEAINKWKIIKIDMEYDTKKKKIEEKITKLSNSLNNEDSNDSTILYMIKIILIVLTIIGIFYLYNNYKSKYM